MKSHIPSIDKVPQDICDVRRFVVWRFKPNPTKKPSKTPYSPVTGKATSWNAGPEVWSTAQEAITYAEAHGFSGIGFVLGDGYVGIDMDACLTKVDGKTVVAPWAKAIACARESYTEKSPSGTGLHILGIGTAPEGKAGDCELYGAGDRTRYFTFTGQRFSASTTPTRLHPCPLSVAAAQAYIEAAKALAAAAKADGATADIEKGTAEVVHRGVGGKVDTSASVDDDGTVVAPMTLHGRNTPLYVLNKIALRCTSLWLPEIMPGAALKGETWRGTAPGTSSENFSLHPERGATWHSGEANGARRDSMSPVDIALEWADGVTTPAEAAAWLLERLGLDDSALAGLRSLRRKGSMSSGPVDIFAVKAVVAAASWPVDTLPAAVEKYATSLAAIHGVNVGGVLFALFSGITGAVPSQVRGAVLESDWQFPASLYAAIIAPSGSRKSPILNAALAPLKALDARERVAAKVDKREAHGRIVSTATVEGLQARMAEVPAGLVYDADELSGLIGSIDKYSGGSRGGSTDSAFFLTAFDGGPFTVSRKAAGASIDLARTHLSILGGIQPAVLTPLLENLSGDGLLQRFLVAHLDRDNAGARTGIDVAARDAYGAIVTKLSTCAGFGGDLTLTMDAGAADAIFDCEEWARGEAKQYDVSPALGSVLGKAHGMIARIALVIELAKWAAAQVEDTETQAALGTEGGDCLPSLSTVITRASVDKASALYKFVLWPEQRRLYGNAGIGSAADEDAKAVAVYILSNQERLDGGFTARDVYRNSRRFRPKNARDDLFGALDELEHAGWLTRKTVEGERFGRYEVDPQVFDGRFSF